MNTLKKKETVEQPTLNEQLPVEIHALAELAASCLARLDTSTRLNDINLFEAYEKSILNNTLTIFRALEKKQNKEKNFLELVKSIRATRNLQFKQ